MRRSTRGGPVRALSGVAVGLYRCAVLVALTAVVPAAGALAGWGGARTAASWASSSQPTAVRVLAVLGEALMVTVWSAAAVWIAHLLAGRPLTRAARHRAGRWLGLRIEVDYQTPAQVVRMATGHWWDGHEYHGSEREARRRARMNARFHDPQLTADLRWELAAAVTVLPVAALPPLAVAGGAYLTLTTAPPWTALAAIAAGLAAAPFAWRVLGPPARRCLGPVRGTRFGRRIRELETARADLTRTQADELERIERGLHDGAQARLVAMGMSMGAAELLVDADPAAAKAVLAEARASSVAALAELRALVRGINPPVLVERGLADAVRALALDAPVEVTVRSTLPSRPERPVEAALYFAVAELLTNVAKHAHATRATVELAFTARTVTATVTDDGSGGAVASTGSGLSGVERRATAFGGTLEIDSPPGGPTRVTVEVPCALS